MAPHFDEQLLKETGDAAGDAELGSISIGDLIKGDEKTRADLFTACRHLGFFYLDCRDHLRPTLQLKSRRSLPLHSNFMIFRMPKRINGLASCTREIQNSNRVSHAQVLTNWRFYIVNIFWRYKAAGDRTGCVEGKKDGWEEVLVSIRKYSCPVTKLLMRPKSLVLRTSLEPVSQRSRASRPWSFPQKQRVDRTCQQESQWHESAHFRLPIKVTSPEQLRESCPKPQSRRTIWQLARDSQIPTVCARIRKGWPCPPYRYGESLDGVLGGWWTSGLPPREEWLDFHRAKAWACSLQHWRLPVFPFW